MSTTPEVSVADAGGVRWIALHRPDSRNGLTVEVNQQLVAALESAAGTREVRAIVLYGAGGAFCSGLDLKAAAGLATGPIETEARMRRWFHGLIRAMRACPQPVIAAVDGPAVGFGCDLALAADLRFCSERARFGQIFAKRGLMPDGGGTYTLPRLIGVGRALELMLTGEVVDAAESYRLGLANKVVPVEGYEAAARAYAERLAAGSPLVHQAVKQAVYAGLEGTLDTALEAEVRGQLRLLRSADFAEGVAAFFQKREPKFKGE